ncbi:NucA/NucB deoxyribonuclease domain-containing protein [Streptomyces monashensis]|uniref:NucA/NucB deoxyribonuclease domain-containing protein n=1 Tax=Streptomyces monashensis TaxID=1678012 RepID=UPI0033F0B38D
MKRELTVSTWRVPTRAGTPQLRTAPHDRPTPPIPPDNDPTGCNNPTWALRGSVYLRSTACIRQDMRINLIQVTDGVPEKVGEADFTVTHGMTLNPTSLAWSEAITVDPATLSGAAKDHAITLQFAVAAPNVSAKVTGDLFNEFTLSDSKPVTGFVDYSASPAKTQEILSASEYYFTGSAAGFVDPINLHYGSEVYRCDDRFWSKNQDTRLKVPGCVYPFHPGIDEGWIVPSGMAALPGIANNIRGVQSQGLHVGMPGSATLLHRATPEQRAKNYAAVCGGLTPPPGTVLSCDEYPFASTREGGLAMNPPNRAIAWVPLPEQKAQGGILRAFYQSNRILPGDPFYVNVDTPQG